MNGIRIKSTNWKNKVILIAIILLATQVQFANADPDPSKNIIGRMMWVHNWDIPLKSSPAWPTFYSNLIADAEYTHSDSIMIGWGTCFFVKEMNPGQGYRDPQGRSHQDLDDFLTLAHNHNLTVFFAQTTNYLMATGEADCKSYFGNKYPTDKNGNLLGSTTDRFVDFNYPESRAKRIQLIKYVVATFDFDGVHLEEAGMGTAGTSMIGYGIEWTGRAGILAEHGYDINTYSYPFANTPYNANPVLLDMLHEREKSMTLFFKELRENITSLGQDYIYPYFAIEALQYLNFYNSQCITGAGCAEYGLNITDLSKKGYIDMYFTEATSPKKYATGYSLKTQREMMETLHNSTPEIYHSGLSYITDGNLCSDSCLNPLFFDEMLNIKAIGGTSEIFYAHSYLNLTLYPPLWNWGSSGSSITPYQWLHNNPPKTKRTFNPIGLKADNIPLSGLPIITIHPVGQTIVVGQTATLSVVATGASLSYQWQKNGANIPGATSASYNITATALSDSGSTFSVDVKNSFGSVMSNAATITVLPTTSIVLVKNPGFELGTTSWQFYTSGTGTFSATFPGYNGTKAANLSLISGGTNIQLYQMEITLEPNTTYRLSLVAYSMTGHDMTVNLIKHGSPYTNYGLSFTPDLGTIWQTFMAEFNTSSFTGTVNDGRLMFQLNQFAAAGDTYYIDDVRLEKVENYHSIYDINNDGIVNIYDLFRVSKHFGENTTIPYPAYDVNADGKVDISDLILVANNII